jgi:hypothetical protein
VTQNRTPSFISHGGAPPRSWWLSELYMFWKPPPISSSHTNRHNLLLFIFSLIGAELSTSLRSPLTVLFPGQHPRSRCLAILSASRTQFSRKSSSTSAHSLEPLNGTIAPTILIQLKETLKAIENILKWYRDTSRI